MKDKLREEWKEAAKLFIQLKDSEGKPHVTYQIEDIFDFFWNRIEQRDKAINSAIDVKITYTKKLNRHESDDHSDGIVYGLEESKEIINTTSI